MAEKERSQYATVEKYTPPNRTQYTIDVLAAMAERTIKRLWIVILLLVVLLVGSNVAWLWYESQFEDEIITQDVTQEADNGTNSFVGGDYYGTAEN